MALESTAAFLRLFIAIAVPMEVREEISRAQDKLKRNSPPGTVRWAPPDQFHITLKFLGDMPAKQVEAVKQSVAPICAGSPALHISARGIGFFPDERSPRVIWVGARDPDGQLYELYRHIDDALRAFTLAERPEKFTSHITLGRFKPGHHAGIPKLVELAKGFHDRHFGDWRAGEVMIFRSELTSVRAEHTAIANFRLTESSQ